MTGAVDICRAHEATDIQMKRITSQNGTSEEINKAQMLRRKMRSYGKNEPVKYNKPNPKTDQGSKSRACMFCNNHHEFKRNLCPAFNKNCDNCGKKIILRFLIKILKVQGLQVGPMEVDQKEIFPEKIFILWMTVRTLDSSESLLKVDSVYLTRPKQTINPNTAVRKQWIA